MKDLPETRYAKNGDVHIAYQVVGDGPVDLVMVAGAAHHVEFLHEMPGYTRALGKLGSFARVITFDKRGSGLSDPIAGAPSLETRMDDVRAVMDAAGSKRATLFGCIDGGPMCALFAATYPDRTTGLVLYNTFARVTWAEDYPAGYAGEEGEELIAALVESWGIVGGRGHVTSSVAWTPELRSLWAKLERTCISPGAFRDVVKLNREIDVRAVLPAVRVPALVLHRREEVFFCSAFSQYLAEHIPDARLVELDGADYWPLLGDSESVLAEVGEFVTGQRHSSGDGERILATVLFTDIVSSTEQASALGDRRWTRLLEGHDDVAKRQLERFRGKMIKSTGDGILGTFDGPARAIECARAIRDGVRPLGLEIRAGLHVGEVEIRGDDIGGIAVHTAARVLEEAGPGEVLVSRTLTDLVAGSDLRFEDRGEHKLTGLPQAWQLFATV